MIKKKIFISLMALVSLSSCSNATVTYEPSDYILETEYKDDYRILQLTDIHLANKDDQQRQFDFLKETIELADPDLIVITGDLFTFADKTTAKRLFAFFDSFDSYWTCTFGNHDEQCYFSIDWLTKYLNNYGSKCLFKDIQDDDVYGNANFAINLKKDNKVFEQIIMFDSNRYHYGSYYGYDYIKDNQIEWYENLVNYTTTQNGGTPVDSLAFFHIPLCEFDEAYQKALDNDPEAILEYGEQREPVCCPDYNSGLFEKMLALQSTKGIFVGHDHTNNYRIKYKGIYLSYGINSSDRIYYDESLIGGQVIVIHNDHKLTFEPITHDYKED